MLRFQPPVVPNESFINFGAAIAQHAAGQGDKTALIVDGREVSWRDFGAMVAQVAGKLRAEGVGKGGFVATLGENSLEHVVIYCATLAAGACNVPLPVSATPEALVRMVSDSGAAMLFASPGQMAVAEGLGAPRLMDMSGLFDWASDATPAEPVDVSPDDLFDIIYSSGTTGLPKGILHDHRFRSRQLSRITNFGLTGEARMIISTPVYSNTTLFGMLPSIVLGATLVVMSKFNTVEFLKLSEAHKLTHAILVPVQYMRLMNEPTFGDYDLTSYACKFSTSAPLAAPLIAKVMERWPGNLVEVYGMTEGGISTALNCGAFPDKWDTVGRAGDGVDMRVIDDQGNELPRGSFGELVGRSPSMMPAYHNLPDKTQEILWTDPEGNHFIRSGDMGRIDEDGFIHLMDRKKDMIISGGFNIYAADLEAVLRAHPDVADTAVIAVPSEAWGETPLGFVILKAGADTTAEAIRDWANAQLGKTQRLSEVVLRDDLPRSDIGKILKRDLRAPYWPAS
ncbi:4-coumarate--CoA ligase [Oceanicola sp. 22II-s10i]|uniref:class I adenylate-forming enzyme family protein n=1 Tax=Oceanicola sp. 22II-s10i TaxID=1317116 RepID=UPI000B52305B|nr:class I adenylate-forming enzyme family protein [Oceanicola sp. 22II-s10i]OWU85909.1 4-coumarate--CoA ligase [Oceanicola sp. 22II-s10i]